MKKSNAIYQDQRIAEEFCNFKCEYCGGLCPNDGYSTPKDKDGNLTVPKEWKEKIKKYPKQIRDYFKNQNTFDIHYKLAYDVMQLSKKVMKTDILKLSGGELTIYNNWIDFVEKINKDYLSIQILSNGLNIKKEDILRCKEMKNVSFQISIDGTTHSTNYSKSHSEGVTKKVLENIKYMLTCGIGVEINCVLTKYNIDKFDEFLNFFKGSKNLIIVPRPVRGEARKFIDFSNEQINHFEEIVINNYNEYSYILPPLQYFKRMLNMMKNKKRNYQCYIPYFVQSIDGYGNFEICPLGLVSNNEKNIVDGSANAENILLNSEFEFSNNYNQCNYCMVQYEMFNLYVDNEITEDDLKRLPSLNNDKIISDINEIKKLIIIKRIIEDNYKLKNIKIVKNEISTDGNVYNLRATQGKYILKVYNDEKHSIAMKELLTRLQREKFYVPKIINDRKKEKYIEINDKDFMIYSFLDGKKISEEFGNIPNNITRKLANELRRFHDVCSDFDNIGLKNINFFNHNLRKTVLHFDLTRDNIFYNKGIDKIGFIDFDDAKYGEAIIDVAILITNLYFSKTRGAHIEGVKTLVEEYYKNDNENKTKEIVLIKKAAIMWINYILNENEFDSSTKDSLEVRKNLIEKVDFLKLV